MAQHTSLSRSFECTGECHLKPYSRTWQHPWRLAEPHGDQAESGRHRLVISTDPGVRGFEFNAPAANGPYTRLTLRDPQHTYEYEAFDPGARAATIKGELK